MIHLINRIYADYTGTGTRSNQDTIYANQYGKREFLPGEEPLDRYEGLAGVYETFGDLTTFLEYLLPLNRKVVILLDEEDLNRLHVALILALYPKLSVDMVHRIVKLSVVNHKFNIARMNSQGKTVQERLKALTIPTKHQVIGWMHQARNQRPFSPEMKKLASFEFLLANALATQFDPENVYTQSFVKRMDTILWKTVAWDFVSVRRDMLYGLYNIRETFGYNINLERDDIDRQILHYQDSYLFDYEADASRIDLVKKHFPELREAYKKLEEATGSIDIMQRQVYETMSGGDLTVEEIKRLVELDKTFYSSQLFGRTEFKNNMNNIFIGYLYKAKPSELKELVL